MEIAEFQISTVIFDKNANSPVVILKNDSLNRIIPIFIGACEALAIKMSLNNVTYPRPISYDLILSILRKFKMGVESVIINKIESKTFYAKIKVISLDGKNESMLIDSRTSDAIVLAIKVHAKIYINMDVVLEAGELLEPEKKVISDEMIDSFIRNIIRKGENDAEDGGSTEG
jgi:bifunctional DNase/RNase